MNVRADQRDTRLPFLQLYAKDVLPTCVVAHDSAGRLKVEVVLKFIRSAFSDVSEKFLVFRCL